MSMSFTVRELDAKDFSRGFFETLENLREVGKLKSDLNRAEKILKEMKSKGSRIFVAEKDGKIIGSITLLIEQKFIRNGGKAGHIEDVSTRKGFEGKGVGSALVQKALETARKEGCYKVVLDCSEANVKFYENNGFKRNEIGMKFVLR